MRCNPANSEWFISAGSPYNAQAPTEKRSMESNMLPVRAAPSHLNVPAGDCWLVYSNPGQHPRSVRWPESLRAARRLRANSTSFTPCHGRFQPIQLRSYPILSVMAVHVCITEALEPRLCCHLLISASSPPISVSPCRTNILTGIILLRFDGPLRGDGTTARIGDVPSGLAVPASRRSRRRTRIVCSG